MGFMLSNTGCGAAAMMVSVPAFAPATPPDTGASTNRRPVASTREASAYSPVAPGSAGSIHSQTA